MGTLEHRVVVSPGYDLRGKGRRNYGIRGCDVKFYVIGPAGTIQLIIMTDWYPTSARDGHRAGSQTNKPWVTDVGCHAREPQYDGQSIVQYDCHLIGGPCYYDGTSLNEAWEEGLVNGGTDWLWPRLEQLYHHRFEGGDYPDLSYEPVPYPEKS